MVIVLAIAAGAVVFWLLYALVRFVFNTRLDVWPLVLFFVLHASAYLIGFAGLIHQSSVGTAAGWFLIGPLLGGLWVTLRTVPSAARRPAATVMAEVNLLVTSGAIIAVLLGVVYGLLKLIGVAP